MRLTFCLTLICFACASQKYEYKGRKYKIYNQESKPSNPKNVYALDLSGKGIESIPPMLVDLSNLIYLNLSRNQIHELDINLCKLAKVKVIVMSENEIKKINDCFFELVSLETLSL